MEEKEFLTRADAAAYLNLDLNTFDSFVTYGFINPAQDSSKFETKNLKKIIYSWEAKHFLEQYHTSMIATHEYYRIFDNCPYSSMYIGQLIANFNACNNNGVISEDEYVKWISNMAAPHLVSVKPMTHVTSLWFYLRTRQSAPEVEPKIVIESESIVAKTRKLSYEERWKWNSGDYNLCHFDIILNEIDQEIFDDIANNVGTVTHANRTSICSSIMELISIIGKKTGETDPECYWVVFPPELQQYAYSFANVKIGDQQLAPNFKFIGIKDNIKVYVSRNVEEDQILVGMKSEPFAGYLFAPYCLMVWDQSIFGRDIDKEPMAIYSKKLGREGSQSFARIKIQD